MKVTESVPEKVKWQDVSNYFMGLDGSHYSAFTSYMVEESKPHNLNYILLISLSAIRTALWTSYEYKANSDMFGLGGRFLTYRDSIRAGADELARYEDTSLIPEEEEILKMYKSCIDACLKLSEPTIPPEHPKPKPEEPKPKPEEPKPEEPKPEEPSKPGDWKKGLGFLGTIASILLSVWGIISIWIPSPVSGIVKIVLEAIKNIFGG